MRTIFLSNVGEEAMADEVVDVAVVGATEDVVLVDDGEITNAERCLSIAA